MLNQSDNQLLFLTPFGVDTMNRRVPLSVTNNYLPNYTVLLGQPSTQSPLRFSNPLLRNSCLIEDDVQIKQLPFVQQQQSDLCQMNNNNSDLCGRNLVADIDDLNKENDKNGDDELVVGVDDDNDTKSNFNQSSIYSVCI